MKNIKHLGKFILTVFDFFFSFLQMNDTERFREEAYAKYRFYRNHL